MSLFRKWKAQQLAIKILVCMALGILVGLGLHYLDRPILLSEIQTARQQLEEKGVEAPLLQGADSNGNGKLDRSEMEALFSTPGLRPSDEVALWDVLNDSSAARAFLFADGGTMAVLQSMDTNSDGRLDRGEIERLPVAEGLSDDARRAARSMSRSVAAGRGEYLAKFLAIVGDLFLGLIKAVVVPLVFIAVFVGIAGNDDVATVKKIGVGIIFYFLFTTLVSVSR
ncbi:MAG: cation:dicarboxylase symporter family transporter [Verrucomicrobiota bacterium]